MTTRQLLQEAGRYVSKSMNINVSGTNRDVVLKQIYHRLASVGDNIHGTTTFDHAWETPGYTVIGGS